MALQRTAGNRAVSRLIQAKLTVGPVGDKYEQEADRVADSVMRTPDGVSADGRPPTVNRLQRSSGIGAESTGGGFEPSADFQSQLSEQLGGGTPLPGGVRNFMETRFGADFGNVKVHTGSQSVQLNRDIGAQAFTHGSDVFFGAGKYQPGSEGGNRILAHELTHVVQQGGDANSGAAQRSPPIQRAVGFEFEDPTWTVFKLQPGLPFRDPNESFGSRWSKAGGLKGMFSKGIFSRTPGKFWKKLFHQGNVAEPGSEKTDEEQQVEKYTGENVYQKAGGGSHINERVGEFNLQTGPKKGTLHQGKHYVVEPDGPYSENGVTNRMDLEIVTEPFPETEAGFKKLMNALDDMQVLINKLSGKASKPWNGEAFEYSKFITPSDHGFTDQSIYIYGGTPGGRFKPQATAGTDLADLPELMETLGGNVEDEQLEDTRRRAPIRKMVHGKEDPKDLSSKAIGTAPGLAEVALDELRKDRILEQSVDKARLKGFLSLAIANIQLLQSGISASEGIKTRMPLLSRYSMVTLFNQIPEEVQDILRTPDGRAALIRAFSTALAGTFVKGDMDDSMVTSGTIYKAGTDQKVTELMNVLKSFTRADWLMNVLDGHDLLKPDDLLSRLKQDQQHKDTAAKYDKSIAIYGRGYGNTKNVREVKGEKSGGLALLENRMISPWEGMGSEGMTMDQVHEFAMKYFSWLYSIKQNRVESDRLKEEESRRREEEKFSDMVGTPPLRGPSPLALAQQDETEWGDSW